MRDCSLLNENQRKSKKLIENQRFLKKLSFNSSEKKLKHTKILRKNKLA